MPINGMRFHRLSTQRPISLRKGLLDIAERVYPGFTDALEELEVSTPLTHLRYLGHPGGAFYGFDQYAKDSNLFVSPLSGIEGLYFAGAWAGMGGFQPTLESGVAAAKAAYGYLETRGAL
jgi:phytoene dehydrogenase-like protein